MEGISPIKNLEPNLLVGIAPQGLTTRSKLSEHRYQKPSEWTLNLPR